MEGHKNMEKSGKPNEQLHKEKNGSIQLDKNTNNMKATTDMAI